MAATFSSSSALVADVSAGISAGWEDDVETAWGDEFAPLIEGGADDWVDPDAVVLCAGDEDFYDLGDREHMVEVDEDTGERFIDVEQAGPRDRRAEAQEYLEQAMTSGRSLVERAADDDEGGNLFPTRNEAVDRLLAGGVGRGEMVEVTGWRSSGRFSLVLSLIAATTQSGESVALVDLGDHLDPGSAQAAGVDLERVLWMRPETVKQALGCAEMALGVGFALVVLELGTPPLGGRGAEAAWLRLQRATLVNRCALFISAPYRVSGTAAHVVLELHRGNGGWLGRGAQPRLFGGLFGQVELTKARCPRLKLAIEQQRSVRADSPSPDDAPSRAPAERPLALVHPAQPVARAPGGNSTKPASAPNSALPAEAGKPPKVKRSRSLRDTALEMAVRFDLRRPSTSVAELAAPMRRAARGRWWEMPQSRLQQTKSHKLSAGARHLDENAARDHQKALDDPCIEMLPEPLRRHQLHEHFVDVRADLEAEDAGAPGTEPPRTDTTKRPALTVLPSRDPSSRGPSSHPPTSAAPSPRRPQEVLHAG